MSVRAQDFSYPNCICTATEGSSWLSICWQPSAF